MAWVGPGIQEPTDCERRQRDRTLDADGFVKRLPIFLVVLLVALAGCTGDSAAPSSMRTPTSASSSSPPTSSEIVDEQCVDEMVDQPPDEAVGEADLAAWLIEDQLPPPLRTAGLQSGATTILLDGEVVGTVTTEEISDGIFTVTGYSFCVPSEVELARVDVATILGDDWRLVDSTPALGLPADAEIRLTITGERAGGRALCNDYAGLVAAGPEGAWRISELFFTEMGCNDAESAYFDRFGATTSWSLDGSDLVLEGPDGALRYAPD